jgi:predicted P-loop ATPase/GTPase
MVTWLSEDLAMKVWISKYALTKGVFEADGRIEGSMAIVKGSYLDQYFHGEGYEWHRTELEALSHAIKMAAKQANSLKKKLAKNEREMNRLIRELEQARLKAVAESANDAAQPVATEDFLASKG